MDLVGYHPRIGLLMAVSMIILLLVLPQKTTSASLTPVQGLYIDRVVLWSMSTPLKMQTVPPTLGYGTNVSWRYSLANIVETCLGLYQFHINPSRLLSFDVDLEGVTNTGATITLMPYGVDSGINTISFSVLILTDYLHYFQVVTQTFNLGSGTLQGVWYISNFTISPTRLVFEYGNSWAVQYLRSFRYTQTVIIPNQVFGISYVITNTTFQVQIQFQRLDLNNLESATVSVVFIKPRNIHPNIAIYSKWIVYGNAFLPYTPIINFGVPVQLFGFPGTEFNCFNALTWIDIILVSGAITSQITMSGSDIAAIIQSNINGIALLALCFAHCPSSQFIYSNQSVCNKCSDYIPYCQTCYSSINCSQCFQNAFPLSLNRSCSLCSDHIKDCRQCLNSSVCVSCYRGNLVVGGCTTTPGCIQVQQYPTLLGPKSVCLACDEIDYSFEPINQTCSCKIGFMAGRYCTTVFGCIVTYKVGSEVKCSFCDVRYGLKLYPAGNQCVCREGYNLQNGICTDVCGDGVVLTDQCDDGNIFDGDGCSSSCKVEKFHRCNSSSPSQCKYIGPYLTAKLIDTRKTPGLNQGKFTFSFSPKMPLLQKYNYSSYFNFQCENAIFKVVSWSYAKGEATLLVDFETDLQTRHASVNFTFDQTYIRYPPILFQFTVRSNGKMLVIPDQSPIALSITYILLSSACISLFLLFVGSWLQKMVGVELVNTLQIIYYLHFTAHNYTRTMSYFLEMSLLGLSDLFLWGDDQNITVSLVYQRPQFSMIKADIVLLIVFCILSIISLINTLLMFSSGLCARFVSYFYLRYSLPIILGLFFPFLLMSFTLLSNNKYEPQQDHWLETRLRSFFLLSSTTLLSFLVFLGYFRFRFQDQLSKSQKQDTNGQYTQLYIGYLVIQLLLLCLWLRENIYFLSYCFLASSLLKFIHLLWIKPYRSCLENISIAINMLTVIIFQAFLLLRKFGLIENGQDTDGLYVLPLSLLIAICSAMGLARVIKQAIKLAYLRLSHEGKHQVDRIEDKNIQNELKVYNNKGGMIQQLLHASFSDQKDDDEKLIILKDRMTKKFRTETKHKIKQSRAVQE